MNEKTRILAVDDEMDILEVLQFNLEKAGHQLATTSNGRSAVELSKIFKPDVILMDVLMPELDGIEACREIRQTKEGENILVILMSALGEEYSQISGFEAGADDYVLKPFNMAVLLSRINALLSRRKFYSHPVNGDYNGMNDLTISREYYTVFKNENEINLPRKEFEILSLIASKPNQLFTRDEIYDHIWGNDTIVGERTLDVHIRNIRSKIGGHHIRTVKGLGYKFTQL